MRRILMVAAIALVGLALAGAASASIRHDVRFLVAKVSGASSAPAKPEQSDAFKKAKDDDRVGHGASVSAAARDKDAVATKSLPNGKKVTNHGQAVSAAAHARKDKPAKGRANGHD